MRINSLTKYLENGIEKAGQLGKDAVKTGMQGLLHIREYAAGGLKDLSKGMEKVKKETISVQMEKKYGEVRVSAPGYKFQFPTAGAARVLEEGSPTIIINGRKEESVSDNVSGDTVETYSDEVVEYIKQKEGFKETAYNSGQTIGYGFDMLAYPNEKIYYNEDKISISPKEGERLLILVLEQSKEQLNTFLDNENIKVNQNTFDALMDIYYSRSSNKLTKEVARAMAQGDDDNVKKLLNELDYQFALIYIYEEDSEKAQAYVDRNPGLKERRNEDYEIYKNGFEENDE